MIKVWTSIPLLQLGGPSAVEWQNSSRVTPLLKGTGRLFVHYSSVKLGLRGGVQTGRRPKILVSWSLGQYSSTWWWHWDSRRRQRERQEDGNQTGTDLVYITWSSKVWGTWQRPPWMHTGWSSFSVSATNKKKAYEHNDGLFNTFIEQRVWGCNSVLCAPAYGNVTSSLLEAGFCYKDERAEPNAFLPMVLSTDRDTALPRTCF